MVIVFKHKIFVINKLSGSFTPNNAHHASRKISASGGLLVLRPYFIRNPICRETHTIHVNIVFIG